jgi:hypothetical protein
MSSENQFSIVYDSKKIVHIVELLYIFFYLMVDCDTNNDIFYEMKSY